jgi:hypothetical protein
MANIMIEWFTNNSMKINPDKFNTIIFNDNRCMDLNFNGISVTSMDEVKLLGVKIDKQLKFDNHVSDLCKKTSRQVNALSRIRNIANEESKNTLYKTFVLSNFNYCATLWHFCSNKSVMKMEKLNKRALRVVFDDYSSSYCELLKMSNKECLFSFREKCIIHTVVKCTQNLVPSYLRSLFQSRSNMLITRSKNIIIQPKVRTTRYGLNSLRYEGARLWNKMDNNMKTDNYDDFKILLKNYQKEYQCNVCIFCKILHL